MSIFQVSPQLVCLHIPSPQGSSHYRGLFYNYSQLTVKVKNIVSYIWHQTLHTRFSFLNVAFHENYFKPYWIFRYNIFASTIIKRINIWVYLISCYFIWFHFVGWGIRNITDLTHLTIYLNAIRAGVWELRGGLASGMYSTRGMYSFPGPLKGDFFWLFFFTHRGPRVKLGIYKEFMTIMMAFV